MRLAALALALASSLLAYGCRPPGPATAQLNAEVRDEPRAAAAAPLAGRDDAHEAGRRIYNFRCYYCHGYSGDARTLASSFLSPAPRDFRSLPIDALSRDRMLAAVGAGVAGSAMAAFGAVLGPDEIERVVDFVREEFMRRKAANTAYHTAENGWRDHDRYRAAYPFATGEIPMDRSWDALDSAQAAGKRLYLSACVSCHDRGRVASEGSPWELRGVSYPPGNYEETHEAHAGDAPATGHAPHAPAAHSGGDALGDDARAQSGPIDPYELHETPPRLKRPTALALRGERVFQANCAHCHAADGSGRNWIGSFLEPHPPDFTVPAVSARLKRESVLRATRDGLPGTSMPAWKQVLAPRELAAVTAYVVEAFGVKAAARPVAPVAAAR